MTAAATARIGSGSSGGGGGGGAGADDHGVDAVGSTGGNGGNFDSITNPNYTGLGNIGGRGGDGGTAGKNGNNGFKPGGGGGGAGSGSGLKGGNGAPGRVWLSYLSATLPGSDFVSLGVFNGNHVYAYKLITSNQASLSENVGDTSTITLAMPAVGDGIHTVTIKPLSAGGNVLSITNVLFGGSSVSDGEGGVIATPSNSDATMILQVRGIAGGSDALIVTNSFGWANPDDLPVTVISTSNPGKTAMSAAVRSVLGLS